MKALPIRPPLYVILPVAVALAAFGMAHAQQATAPADQPPAAAQPAAAKTFSQQELDELLAPVALYPDALLAQVLMASTYPLEVVAAARWVKANAELKDKALEDAVQSQPWDPSVKALVVVPQVLDMMNEKLDWTQKLGDAFLADQAKVMATAQNLRKKAQGAGTLETTPEQVVKTQTENNQTIIVIEPAQPETVYVPVYNPAVVYGTWWYPYPPPYYYYPPGYVARPGLVFTAGVVVGAALWGNCHWGWGRVDININRYNSFNRTTISNREWNHNVEHRKGVAYRDGATAQKYNRGGNAQAIQSREQFRGRAEAGRAELQGMDRSQLQGKVSGAAASRDLGSLSSSAAQRDFSSRAGSFGGQHSGGFSGAGNGAGARAASARGSMSRGGGGRMGGGRR